MKSSAFQNYVIWFTAHSDGVGAITHTKSQTHSGNGWNINLPSLLHMKKYNLNCPWLMNFYISEQRTYGKSPEKHHWSENCSSPYWKDYAFWLQTYSRQVFLLSELVSQSARLYTAVSCWKRVRIMKHLDNYFSPGFWTTIMWLWHREVFAIWPVILDPPMVPSGKIKHRKARLYCIQCVEIFNQCKTLGS